MGDTIGEVEVLSGGENREERRWQWLSEIRARARHEQAIAATWACHHKAVACREHVKR